MFGMIGAIKITKSMVIVGGNREIKKLNLDLTPIKPL